MEQKNAVRRINLLRNHFEHLEHKQPTLSPFFTSSATNLGKVGTKNPDDIVIVTSVRTAIGKARRGSFKDSGPDELLAPLLQHVLKSFPQVKPEEIGDVVIGTVLPRGGQGSTEIRVASLLAGVPIKVPCTTVNRQCSSGLQAIANVAAGLKAGYYDIAIAGGVESMSINPMAWDGKINSKAVADKVAVGCYMNMGQTSEEVAARFGVSREKQDKFSVVSHQRAHAAITSGKFKDEIVPIKVTIKDEKTNETKEVLVSQDEGVRGSTKYEDLAKLRPAFKKDGSTTAGNSSQLSDGAAVALVTTRKFANERNLPILGVLRSFAAVGVEPAIMGVGPAEAIPKALELAGVKKEQIDVFEINEAFASQATYCIEKLGLNTDKVNPNGGAIALGHPLGMTGARMTATLLHELKRRKGNRLGVVSMCIGSGMGAAAVYETEG